MVALKNFVFFTFALAQALSGQFSSSVSSDTSGFVKRALPKFQNFQPNDNSNPKIQQLTQGFKDMVTVVNVLLQAENTEAYQTIFPKYFKDGMQDAVKSVFTNMVQPAASDPSTGSDNVAQIIVDANDYLTTQAPEFYANHQMVAYTSEGETTSDPWTSHYSDIENLRNAYAYPALSGITCGAGGDDTGTIGTIVSDKMLSLGGYAMVHEMTHAAPIFGTDATKSASVLKREGTQDPAYGPMDCRKLVAGQLAYPQGCDKSGQLRDAAQCIDNADSYAWFATEIYSTITCKRSFGDPTSNSYTPTGVCPGICQM